jgi:AsmA protein
MFVLEFYRYPMILKLKSGIFWLRAVLWVSLGLIFLFVLFALIAYSQFDPKDLNHKLQSHFSALGRSLVIDGAIHPKMSWKPLVVLSKVSLSDVDGKTPFAFAEKIEIKVSPWSLLLGNMDIVGIAFDGLEARMVQDKHGQMNIRDLLKIHPWNNFSSRTLEQIKLSRSNIFLFDEQNLRWSLRDTELNITHINHNPGMFLDAMVSTPNKNQIRLNFSAPVAISKNGFIFSPIEGKMTTKTGTFVEVTGKASGSFSEKKLVGQNFTFHFSAEKDGRWKVKVPSFVASVEKIQIPLVHVSGRLDSKSSEKVDVEATIDQLLMGKEQNIKAEKIDIHMNYSEGKEHHFRVILSSPFAMQAEQVFMTGADLKLRFESSALSVPIQTAIKGDLHIDTVLKPILRFKGTGSLDHSPLRLDVYQEGLLRPKSKADIQLDRLDLNNYLPKSVGSPAALFSDNQSLQLGWLDLFDLHAKLDIKELFVGRFRLGRFKSDMQLKSHHMSLKNMEADIYGGQLQGGIQLNIKDQIPHMFISQQLKYMNIEPGMRDLFNFGQIEGRANGYLRLQSFGPSFMAWRDHMHGTLDLNINRGVLRGLNLAKILRSQNLTDTQKQDRTDFSKLKASFFIEQGVAKNRNFELESNALKAHGRGNVDLRKNIVDYAMQITPLSSLEALKDVKVPIKITGKMESPKYSLDFQEVAKKQAEREEVLKEYLSLPNLGSQNKIFTLPK